MHNAMNACVQMLEREFRDARRPSIIAASTQRSPVSPPWPIGRRLTRKNNVYS